MIKIGIVGLGFMGLTHWRAYQKLEGAKVVAIADLQEARARGDVSTIWGNLGARAGGQLPVEGVTSTTDYRKLIEMSDVDVIDICVPTPSHVQIAVDALNAGKHVVCEKPLALTSAEAARVQQAAEKSRGFFLPAQCMRFWPTWEWLKRAIDEKRYGKVLAATFQRISSKPPCEWYADGSKSGGAILDLHIHDTDYICHLFGKPKSVSSVGYIKHSGKPDHVMTHYHYDDVPLVSAEGGWSYAAGFGFAMRYRVNFEHATADFDIGRSPALLLYSEGKSEPIECPEGDGYLGELGYMLECIQKNQRPTRITAADAVQSVAVIEAEERSIAHRGAVTPVT